MNLIILTQDSTPIIGQVAWLLGNIMNGIFTVIDFIGIPNIGLAIILFTIVVNLLMTPLNIRQQKFSKLSAKMSPEIQAIEAKYKGKSDQNSLMAKNQEVQMVYAKYGVSASGSCVQLLIQMPILFALYRVIQSMPAYVTKIHETFRVLADNISDPTKNPLADGGMFLKTAAGEEFKNIVSTAKMYEGAMNKNLTNGIIDVLNKLPSMDLSKVAEHYGLTDLTYPTDGGQLILSNETTRGLIDIYNNFLGLNMGDSPSVLIQNAWGDGKAIAWGIVIGAVMIPVLSAVTQWINVKLMPQQPHNGGEQASTMAASMKTMNMVMPLMSAWFCFQFPSGLGLYWVAGSVVRSVQQVIINKHIDKMDFDQVIAKNSAKSAKRIEKLKANQEKMNAYANISTRNIPDKASMQSKANISSGLSEKEKNEAAKNASSGYSASAKPGSMREKANMVREYNEKNNAKGGKGDAKKNN